MNLVKFKMRYELLQQSLKTDFFKNPGAVKALVLARSDGIDVLLKDIWQVFGLMDELCLVAVGGYGRAELHLYSDIDLLVLMPSNSHDKHQDNIAKFLRFLWDVGLEVGHASRDIDDCVCAIKDLTVVTSLLESRLILGNQALFSQMQVAIKSSAWSAQSFFVEKQKEQDNRHFNHKDTAYNLEPNLKESPGGLRDIQTVFWIAKWYSDVHRLSDLVKQSYLNENEYNALRQDQLFLWKVRFALHAIANRREDRVAFQYQKQVAEILGYVDTDTMAVEQLMKTYYQTVTRVSRLNDILLQLLEKKILHTQSLNERFIISYGYIQATSKTVFKDQPAAFIEIFLLLAKHNYVRGIDADTLRQMQLDIDIIDVNYHQKRQNNRLFIQLLQQKKGVNKALKLMNRYGVLEHYIPAFGQVVGLMQYDLFHVYTVDQHTLFVIRNLRRFFVSEFEQEFSLCSKVAKTIKKPELLFLAALFHDIAKGRGGDHAKLGAQDALIFCQHHQLPTKDAELVARLVNQHLLMSNTAQREDLDDIEVIKKFAQSIKSITFLKFLYLLTVADIRATKKDLWNDWKDALLKKLFYNTKTYLNNDSNQGYDLIQTIEKAKQAAIRHAIAQGHNASTIDTLFSTLPKDYFLRYELDDILWHLSLRVNKEGSATIVASKISIHNVVDIFVMCEDIGGLFFKLINVLDALKLDIVDAKILTTKDNKAYNTISVLQDEVLQSVDIGASIKKALNSTQDIAKDVQDRHTHRHFNHKLRVHFSYNKKWHLTKITLTMLDKQGLLPNIAYIFYQLNIRLVNARIATMGERVENIFFVSDDKAQPLNPAQEMLLKRAFEEKL